jgi:hypothetical protein
MKAELQRMGRSANASESEPRQLLAGRCEKGDALGWREKPKIMSLCWTPALQECLVSSVTALAVLLSISKLRHQVRGGEHCSNTPSTPHQATEVVASSGNEMGTGSTRTLIYGR